MTRLNMDTVALAYHSGVSPDYIYKILRGERPNISAINLASIANALGVSMEYLVGLSDEPEIEKLFRGSEYPISDAMLPWLLDKAAQLASVARKIEYLDEADRGAVTGFIDQQINQIDTLVAASTRLKSILPVE
jgi:transcriptional regulator with XRE-family HTH domain